MSYKIKDMKIRLNKISKENFVKFFNRSNKKNDYNGNTSCYSTISANHYKNAIKYLNNNNSQNYESSNELNTKTNFFESSKTKINFNTSKHLTGKKLNCICITDANNKINRSIKKLLFMNPSENKKKNKNKINNNLIKKLKIISPNTNNHKYQKLPKKITKFNTANFNTITNINNLTNVEICNSYNLKLKKIAKPIKTKKINQKFISINKENIKTIPHFHEKVTSKLNESNPLTSKISSEDEKNNFITKYPFETTTKNDSIFLINELNKLIKQKYKDQKLIDFLRRENLKLKEKIKDFLKNNANQKENLKFVNSLELKNRKLSVENERLNLEILELKMKISEFENENNKQDNLDIFPINENNIENKELLQRIKNLEDKFNFYSKNKL